VWLTAGGEASPARGESCHWHKEQRRGGDVICPGLLGYSSNHAINENKLIFIVSGLPRRKAKESVHFDAICGLK
jgi:hypothetical protein